MIRFNSIKTSSGKITLKKQEEFVLVQQLKDLVKNAKMTPRIFWKCGRKIVARVMGVDYGSKRIGIAVSDMMHIAANPFGSVKSVSFKKDALKILEIAHNNDVSTVVLGLPVHMNGTSGEMAEAVYKFVGEIRSLSDIKVEILDERLTTAQAERVLIGEAGISRKKAKRLKDKVAAALILQTYLDAHAPSAV